MRKSYKKRRQEYETFEDVKGVIRSHTSKKNRQHS